MSPLTDTSHEVSGWIVCVDPPNRALTILVDGQVLALDVPPGCAVLLNGQPVRLRLLQSQDRVRVHYRSESAGPVAERIDVNS
jgi:hypothetical protein